MCIYKPLYYCFKIIVMTCKPKWAGCVTFVFAKLLTVNFVHAHMSIKIYHTIPKAWARGTTEGKYSSVHEEPNWENLLDEVESLSRDPNDRKRPAPTAEVTSQPVPETISK